MPTIFRIFFKCSSIQKSLLIFSIEECYKNNDEILNLSIYCTCHFLESCGSFFFVQNRSFYLQNCLSKFSNITNAQVHAFLVQMPMTQKLLLYSTHVNIEFRGLFLQSCSRYILILSIEGCIFSSQSKSQIDYNLKLFILNVWNIDLYLI